MSQLKSSLGARAVVSRKDNYPSVHILAGSTTYDATPGLAISFAMDLLAKANMATLMARFRHYLQAEMDFTPDQCDALVAAFERYDSNEMLKARGNISPIRPGPNTQADK